jgi:hypothetical protein
MVWRVRGSSRGESTLGRITAGTATLLQEEKKKDD